MKPMIFLSLFLFSLAAEATSMKTTLNAEITSHRFDVESPLADLEVVDSEVVIDFVRDQIELHFMLPWSCPVGALCAMVMPVRVFQVENLEVETDECGSTIYVVENDDRPADGIYEKIKVTDLTSSACPRIAIYPPLETTIEYQVKYFDRLGGKEVNFIHRFQAAALH